MRKLVILTVVLSFVGIAHAAPPSDLALVPAFSGLDQPVAVIAPPDGTDRLFVVERPGVIRIYDGEQVLATPFLDISLTVDSTQSEQGLLGLAFHPEYTTNGYFYVSYTRDPGAGLDRSVVSRFNVSGDPNVADAGSLRVVFETEQDDWNHNGGDIHFGPDGYLYIGLGDGGSAYDPLARAQDLRTLLGKMLRVDVDGAIGASNPCGLVTDYAIPADNPYVGTGDCEEIWSYGLRNPWRFSFDRLTGDLWIGDVGQDAIEEIDLQPAASTGGENYGWSCMEGNTFRGYNACDGNPLTAPVVDYQHTGGNCSVSGGYRYRGHRVVGFDGVYVYADFCSGRIWFLADDGGWSASEWMDTATNPSGFGQDADGELYLIDYGGTVYRFESASSIFTDGFESGDTSAWASSNGRRLARDD